MAQHRAGCSGFRICITYGQQALSPFDSSHIGESNCDLLAQRTGYELSPATALDESLLGLRTIALVADGRAETSRDAQAVFGRDCHIAA